MSEIQFTEKPLPSVLLAQTRSRGERRRGALTTEVAGVEEIGDLVGTMFGRLMPTLGQASVPFEAAPMAWYEGREEAMALGVGVPIAESSRQRAESLEGVQIEELPEAERALTVVHLGAMDSIARTWQTLQSEMENLGPRPSGRGREIYLEMPQDNPDAWVTELQLPIS